MYCLSSIGTYTKGISNVDFLKSWYKLITEIVARLFRGVETSNLRGNSIPINNTNPRLFTMVGEIAAIKQELTLHLVLKAAITVVGSFSTSPTTNGGMTIEIPDYPMLVVKNNEALTQSLFV